ncbi:hypothetical protein FPY71_08640 [Aureimonas fodinaquatilis]|uniref:Glycosyltransferase family 4 protein n=1 Tax=Aureimonas fodinaquatilis TaxID=2565783 RepID=A0A5B0DZC9_9HYPH|nr:glycosyltransferase [Aureimonas fodinaquatilis]KAA0970559.1 hypothetical protein FPY71_08640 [Aureimonas fodinaquatilis]
MAGSAVMVAMGDVVLDNRVLKMAAAMRRAHPEFVLIGTLPHPKSGTVQPIARTVGKLKCLQFPDGSIHAGGLASELEHLQARLHYFTSVICDHIEGLSPQSVHTHGSSTLPIGREIKRRLGDRVQWIHDVRVLPMDLCEPLKDFAVRLETEHLAHADRITTETDEMKAALLKRYAELPPINVIYNTPLLRQMMGPATVRRAVHVPDAPLGVYAGPVVAGQGAERLIAVLQEVPDLHCAICTASSGPYIEAVKAEAEQVGVAARLHWLPALASQNAVAYLSDATFGLLPMQYGTEADLSLPAEFFDFVFAGLPVLSQPFAAIQNFLETFEAGLCCDFSHAKSVANALQRITDSYGLKGEDFSRMRRRFCWEVQERHLLELYLMALGFDGQVIDTVTRFPVPRGPIRVLHGITGAAGQPGALARALNQHAGIYAKSLQITRSKFAYPSDIFYPVAHADAASMLDVMQSVHEDFDIFHMHSRGFVFDRKHTSFPTGHDLVALKAAGKSVIVHFRGSEARIQSMFQRFSPYNYVEDDEDNTVRKYPEDAKRRHIRLIGAVADRVLVPDPELQSYVPGSLVVERAIDLTEWRHVGIQPNSRPLIVHAPSRRGVKGTSAVIAAVENLRLRGFDFDFKLVEGLPQAQARKIYEQADIVVDQLRIGWYGVLAVECMALGKPVVAYIRDDLHHTFEHGLPLANANPVNVEHVLEQLLTNESDRMALALKGRAYVEQVHCSTVVANKLVKIYEEVRRAPRAIDVAAYLEILKEQTAIHDRVVDKCGGLAANVKGQRADLADAMRAIKKLKRGGVLPLVKEPSGFAHRIRAVRRRAGTYGLAPTALFIARRTAWHFVKIFKNGRPT